MLNKHNIIKTGQIIVSILLLVFICIKFNIKAFNFLGSILFYEWFILSLGIVVLVIPIVSAIRWKILLYYSGIIEDILSIIRITYISLFWGFIIPSATGYDVIRIYLMEKRHPSNRGVSGGTVVIERIVGLLLLCLLGVSGTFIVPRFEGTHYIRMLLLGIIIFILAVFWVIRNQNVAHNIEKRFGKVRFLNKVIAYSLKVQEALSLISLRIVIIRVLPFMLIFQLSQITLIYLLFKAIGHDIPFYNHLALAPIVQIITIIPVSFSGVGIREGAFVHFYQLIDIHPSSSFYVSILYYLITMGLGFVIGGIWSIYENIGKIDIIRKD